MTINPAYTSLQDYYNLSGYITGATMNHTDSLDIGGALGGAVVLGILPPAWKGTKWLWNNKGNYPNAWADLKKEHIKSQKNLKSLTSGTNLWGKYKNIERFDKIIKLEQEITPVMHPKGYAQFSSDKKAKYKLSKKESDMYKEVRKKIGEAKKLKGPALKAKLKEIEDAMAKAKLEVHNAKVSGALQPITKRGKAWSKVKQYSGYTATEGAAKKLMAESTATGASKAVSGASKTLRVVSKAAKGNGAFAAVELAFEAPELVETYQKLGAGKGTKQLAKTSAVIGAEVAGYAIGTTVGAGAAAAAGAAAGAAFGSIVPGIGTAVGAIVGVCCGLIGSWLAGKAARAIVGKSELEKAKEMEAEKIAKEAKENPETRKELLAEAGKKLKEADSSDESARKAVQSYEKIADAEIKNEKAEIKDKKEKNELFGLLDSIKNGKYIASSNNASTQSPYNFNFNNQFTPNMFGSGTINSNIPNPYLMNMPNPFIGSGGFGFAA